MNRSPPDLEAGAETLQRNENSTETENGCLTRQTKIFVHFWTNVRLPIRTFQTLFCSKRKNYDHGGQNFFRTKTANVVIVFYEILILFATGILIEKFYSGILALICCVKFSWLLVPNPGLCLDGQPIDQRAEGRFEWNDQPCYSIVACLVTFNSSLRRY